MGRWLACVLVLLVGGCDDGGGAAPPVDWTRPETWEFFPLDDEAFPAVALARAAGERGGTAPAVYNAANEECVEAFRSGQLAFTGIVDVVQAVLSRHDVPSEVTIEAVLDADSWARATARQLIEGRHMKGEQ